MKLLVTGVLGFIGSHFARYCVQKGHTVIGANRNTDQWALKRIEDIRDNIRLIYADLAEDISGICEGIDIVVNFAAKTFVDHSIIDPAPFIRSNYYGTYNLLEQAKRYKVKLFIQISTDEVYGSIEQGYFNEDSPLNPTNPYAATKAAADLLALSYYYTYGLPVIVTRTENNYGYYQHPQKAMPVFISRALNNKKLPIYGDGKHKRMWIRAEDNASAVYYLINHSTPGNKYNIGAKQEMENLTLAKQILSILDKPDSLIEFIPDYNIRPGHDRRYGIETIKIETLGWRPEYKLNGSLEEVVRWYQKNQWWLI